MGADGPVEEQLDPLQWVEKVTTYVALSTNHLVTVRLGGQSLERWLDDTSTETENQVEG